MRKFFKFITNILVYPFRLTWILNNIAKSYTEDRENLETHVNDVLDEVIAQMNENANILTQQVNTLTEKVVQLNNVVAYQRKRHNALTKRINEYAPKTSSKKQ